MIGISFDKSFHMTGSDDKNSIDKDAADLCMLFGPLVILDEEQRWAVPIVKEVPGKLPEFGDMVLKSVDDMDETEAKTVRANLIESYRELFTTVHAADSQETFAEAIAIHFPSEETRIALSRFLAKTRGGGSA